MLPGHPISHFFTLHVENRPNYYVSPCSSLHILEILTIFLACFSICRPKLGGFPLLMLMLLTQTATREHILGSRQTLLLSRNRQEGKKYLSKSSFFLFWVVLSSNTVSNPCSSSFKCTWSAYSMCKRRCTHPQKVVIVSVGFYEPTCRTALLTHSWVFRHVVTREGNSPTLRGLLWANSAVLRVIVRNPTNCQAQLCYTKLVGRAENPTHMWVSTNSPTEGGSSTWAGSAPGSEIILTWKAFWSAASFK